MANPAPQHTPTDGLGTPSLINVSGTGVTAIVAGHQYQVTLSLSGTNTVTLTATLKDVGGNTFTSGNSNSASLKTDNPFVATVAGLVITAVTKGQAVVDVRFPTFDTTDAVDFVYSQVLVNVTA